MIAYVPTALALLGVVFGLLAVGGSRLGLSPHKWVFSAVAAGWLGLIAGTVGLQFLPGMQGLGVGLGMAACGCLAVVTGAPEAPSVRKYVCGLGSLASLGIAAGSLVAFRQLEPGPWQEGMVLLAAHWAAIGGLLTAALVAAGLAVASFGRAGEGELTDGTYRLFARDFAVRAVAVGWIAWPIAQLTHWRFLGMPGAGATAEWFGLGIQLIATGLLIVGWERGTSKAGRVLSAAMPVIIFVVVAVGVGASFRMSVPFLVSLPL